jgi:hypothetical protein
VVKTRIERVELPLLNPLLSLSRPTQWPQYILAITVPICLAAAEGFQGEGLGAADAVVGATPFARAAPDGTLRRNASPAAGPAVLGQLLGGAAPDVLAYHAERAELGEKARHYLQLAGDAAQRVNDLAHKNESLTERQSSRSGFFT